jgi:hypothetical protein
MTCHLAIFITERRTIVIDYYNKGASLAPRKLIQVLSDNDQGSVILTSQFDGGNAKVRPFIKH